MKEVVVYALFTIAATLFVFLFVFGLVRMMDMANKQIAFMNECKLSNSDYKCIFLWEEEAKRLDK